MLLGAESASLTDFTEGSILSPILLKETWYKQLSDKVKNELRNEKDDPVILARKRKRNAGTPPICKAKRGIINWEPPHMEGEDEMSSNMHMEWMQKEYKKREPNMTLVYDKMTRTYPARRKYINNNSPSLQEISDNYPFLFDPQQVCKQSTYCKLYNDVTNKENIFLPEGLLYISCSFLQKGIISPDMKLHVCPIQTSCDYT